MTQGLKMHRGTQLSPVKGAASEKIRKHDSPTSPTSTTAKSLAGVCDSAWIPKRTAPFLERKAEEDDFNLQH